jgi:hypothetical protein
MGAGGCGGTLKDLNAENCKTLKKEIEEDTGR